MMKSSEIRQAFLDFFAARGHTVVPSSSLIPGNDPTLLFTNAGMVPFKDVFLGLETRPYQRATSAQRCVRAGGKHNDLENVGYTARHHTFFEMLGNFSFGDYFKRDAIRYAWEFLTQVLNLPPEKLWVTVFRDDDEAAEIWLNEIGVNAERFSRCDEDDNFWSMGDTGPCGPCTEIFYDHGPEIPGGPPGSPEADGDRYIEIWNLVFMQFNRAKDGTLHSLPKPSVDTGMGLERIAAVVQGVHTNYQIDSFKHLIQALIELVPTVEPTHSSLKVIADHCRATAFLIADGVLPGNEGRGYVLRRIIRRAVRHGHKLGLQSPFFYRLVAPLAEIMGDAYPELHRQRETIERVLMQEEEQFSRTLAHGLQLLKEQMAELTGKQIAGETAFKLYDTFGFPLDLTEDIAREHGLTVDVNGFEQQMQQQRQKSQSASQFAADYFSEADLKEETAFKGYEHDEFPAQLISIRQDGKAIEQLNIGARGALILNQSPFYAESGGQVGDRGEILSERGRFRVDDTQMAGHAIVHYGEMIEGSFTSGETVRAVVDALRRDAIRLNHTATHLLHAALKKVVGDHVHQKGSLVDADRARFDFSHHSPLTDDTLKQLETVVNAEIRANHPVKTELMSLDKAQNEGAVALFGEKYSDEVRVLSLGEFSKELCGGTHAARTGDIGLFKIIAEYGVASGIRRIEMVTGEMALAWVTQQLALFDQVVDRLKTSPEKALDRLGQVLTDTRQLEKQVATLQQQLAARSGDVLTADVQKIGEVKLLVKQLDQQDSQGLRVMLDQLKTKLDTAVIVLYSIIDNKINVVASVSKSLLPRVPHAAEFVKELCGKGGGRPDMAQGGGDLPPDLADKIKGLAGLIKS